MMREILSAMVLSSPWIKAAFKPKSLFIRYAQRILERVLLTSDEKHAFSVQVSALVLSAYCNRMGWSGMHSFGNSESAHMHATNEMIIVANFKSLIVISCVFCRFSLVCRVCLLRFCL